MASPFHVFRKHQRAMLAVVGILCMIGFSISGVGFLGNMSDPSVRGEDPVVATAYGKSLRESEVYALMRQRGLAIRFLGSAIRSGMGEMGRFINPEAFLENVFGPATEQAVVQTWVLAERARRMGLVVSDEAINDYLKRMTENKVRPEVFRAIVKEQQSTPPEVFEALRHELLAFRLREMS
ncbi:MAG TPA: SurA N-terminal domain-containing protein, partial [Pirellulales bacterium]|nr:SurA N-terminal domain-containing protein [Pirellulales bacterium]